MAILKAMSKDAIIEALQQAAELGGLGRDADDASRRQVQLRLAHDLETADELRWLWGKWACALRQCVGISPWIAAVALVDRARDGASPIVIADSLFQFVSSGEADFVAVQPIMNVVVDQRLDIGPDIYLLPPSDLPQGFDRDLAFALGAEAGRERRNGIPPARSALVAEFRCKALFEKIPDSGPVVVMREILNCAFERSRLAIIASGGASPIFGGPFTFVREPGWPANFSAFASGPWIEVPVPVDIAVSQSASIQATFEKMADMNQTLTLALERLAASRSRKHENERAIDLGTAIEILLMHGAKPGEAEITNKISQRGAWLIGKDGDDRLAIANTIRQANTLRSKAVHTGHLPSTKSEEEADARLELFRQTEGIIVRLVDRLFQGWPDWNVLTLDALTGAAPGKN